MICRVKWMVTMTTNSFDSIVLFFLLAQWSLWFKEYVKTFRFIHTVLVFEKCCNLCLTNICRSFVKAALNVNFYSNTSGCPNTFLFYNTLIWTPLFVQRNLFILNNSVYPKHLCYLKQPKLHWTRVKVKSEELGFVYKNIQ